MRWAVAEERRDEETTSAWSPLEEVGSSAGLGGCLQDADSYKQKEQQDRRE